MARQVSALGAIEDELGANGLHRYVLAPPVWLLPWRDSLTCFPQHYPTSLGQDESVLTEAAVKTGFVPVPIVQTETFSAHQLIYDKLKREGILPALAKLASAVQERRDATRLPDIAYVLRLSAALTSSPAAFRLPSRVTSNEQKREHWIHELANPTRPLSEISKSVPHGYRGEKLLDMFYTRQVPLPRAVWYTRAIGAIEIQSQRSRVGFTVATYTAEWTTTVLDFVKKQLAELVVPASVPSTETILGSSTTLVELGARASWTAKFSFIRQLLEIMYEEQLLDQELLLGFVIQQVEASNVAQLPFILVLLQDYLSEVLLSEPLSARLSSVCFARLSEIENGGAAETYDDVSAALTLLLRSVFVSLPDAFIADHLWSTQAARLETMLLGASASSSADTATLLSTINVDLADLTARRDASIELTSDTGSLEPQELETIRILDEIAFPNALSSTHRSLFHDRRHRRPLAQQLPALLNWSISSDRYGGYRIYAVSTLIAMELALPTVMEKTTDIEAGFVRWIDAERPTAWDRVRLLFAELIRARVVSYSSYLHRMIARGETDGGSGPITSLHLSLLRTVALFDEPGLVISKRWTVLHAPLHERLDLAKLLDVVKKELELLVPGLIDASHSASAPHSECGPLFDGLQQLAAVGSHLCITRQVVPAGVHRLLRTTSYSLQVEQHAVLTQVFLDVEDHWGLLTYLSVVLQSHPPRPLLLAVLDIVERHLDVWTATAALPDLASALFAAHEALRGNGINERRLIKLLRRLGSAGHLAPATLSNLEDAFSSLMLSLSSGTMQPLPLAMKLPEIHTILETQTPESIAQTATTLWYRYHAFENWGVVIVDAAVQLLSSVSVAAVTMLLRELNERLALGVDGHLGRWISTMTASEIATLFSGELGVPLAELLAGLAADGTISGSNVLRSVVLPVLTALVQTTARRQLAAWIPISSLLTAILGEGVSSEVTPTNLVVLLRTSSRRATFFTRQTLPDVGRCLVLLLVQRALWAKTDEVEMVKQATTLLVLLSSSSPFRKVVAQEPQALAAAMLESPFATTANAQESYRPMILAGLLFCLNNGASDTPANLVSNEDWDAFLSGLNVWRLAISKIEVQTCLEGLDLDDSRSGKEKLEALNKLSSHFLDRVCLGDSQTFLGEQVVKCYHGRATDELVSVAFSRMSEAVDGLAYSASPELRAASLTALRCTGRLLNTVIQSGRAASRIEPLTLLLVAVKGCLEKMLEDDEATVQHQKMTVAHVADVLEIALRCTTTGATTVHVLFRDCVAPTVKLAIMFATTSPPDLVLTTVLLDTVSRLLLHLHSHGSALALPTLRSTLTPSLHPFLPDDILARLNRLLDPYSTLAKLTNPWEFVDQADPGPLKLPTRHNIAPIDLAHFSAKVVEVVPAVTALSTVPPPRGSTPNAERGTQTNFDSETSCVGISLLARDYRRTLVLENGVPGSTYDAATIKKTRPDLVLSDSSPRSSTSRASPAARASPAVVIPAARGTKRKDPPEVLILDSDDEVIPPVRPLVKRGKALEVKAPAGRTAAKTTGSKTTARASKKK